MAATRNASAGAAKGGATKDGDDAADAKDSGAKGASARTGTSRASAPRTRAAASTAGAAGRSGRARTPSSRKAASDEESKTTGATSKPVSATSKAESAGKARGDGEGKADDHQTKVAVQEEKKSGAGDDGIDMAPPVTLEVDGEKRSFDIDDADLPAWIEDREFTAGDYPYDKRLKKKKYEAALEALQGEMVKMQGWLRDSDERLILVFEGRDAAGKGGMIRVMREYLNPRHARIVALGVPTEREQGQWYYQRYIEHFPTEGELVMFDRSWYNRGVVEPVMGYCTMPEHKHFLEHTPGFERQVAADGIRLLKFWLNIGRETQIKRFHDRRHNPLKIWKLSPNDVKSLNRWDDYTAARDRTLEATHIDEAPWIVVRANDKRRARINAMRALLTRIPYEGKDPKAIGKLDRKIVGEGRKLLK